jgi:hypothetical protein
MSCCSHLLMGNFRTTVESVVLQTQVFGMQSCGTATFRVSSAIRGSFILVRLHVIENRVKNRVTPKKKIGVSSSLVSSYWSLKSPNSQHEYAEVRVVQTAFPIRPSHYSQFELTRHA